MLHLHSLLQHHYLHLSTTWRHSQRNTYMTHAKRMIMPVINSGLHLRMDESLQLRLASQHHEYLRTKQHKAGNTLKDDGLLRPAGRPALDARSRVSPPSHTLRLSHDNVWAAQRVDVHNSCELHMCLLCTLSHRSRQQEQHYGLISRCFIHLSSVNSLCCCL